MTFPKILLLALILTISSAAITINQISGVTNDNLVYSGTIPVGNNNLFFTYYGVDGQKDQASLKAFPLLIIVGNPGTSAQYYSLSGIGPMNLNNDMTLSANPNRFTTTTNLMFIDLLGSGFSFAANTTDLPSEAKTFGLQLSQAVNTFIKESVLGQTPRVFIAGQGTFIRSLGGWNEISSLKGIIHLAPWPEIYAMGRYYGIAGVQLKIYAESQRIAVDSTFTNCYTLVRNGKFLEGHQCLDAIFNFVESKTRNCNLFDVRKSYNLTEFLPLVQYYFSQPSVVATFKAPTVRLFQSQSAYIANKTYVDNAKNYTKDVSQFTKDYYSVQHWFVQGTSDYISYYKGVRNWLENELVFVESDAFKKAQLQELYLQDKLVAYVKRVKQVTYSQILNSGHHILHDQPNILRNLFFSWIGDMKDQATPILTVQ